MWGNWEVCGNFATNLNYSCGGGNVGIWIYDAPSLGENVRTLLLARREEIGSKLCFLSFRSIDEKIRKRLRVTMRRCVLKSINYYFCA